MMMNTGPVFAQRCRCDHNTFPGRIHPDCPEHGENMKHFCHARNCKTEVAPKLFMCQRHWWMLPEKMRREIWAQYRPGQEIDKDPSQEYLAAAMAAVNHVAALERSGVT